MMHEFELQSYTFFPRRRCPAYCFSHPYRFYSISEIVEYHCTAKNPWQRYMYWAAKWWSILYVSFLLLDHLSRLQLWNRIASLQKTSNSSTLTAGKRSPALSLQLSWYAPFLNIFQRHAKNFQILSAYCRDNDDIAQRHRQQKQLVSELKNVQTTRRQESVDDNANNLLYRTEQDIHVSSSTHEPEAYTGMLNRQ